MVQIRHQPEVLLPGQQLVHRRELTGDPDCRPHLPGLGRNVIPGNARCPTVGVQQRGQYVNRRRLAGPIRTEQGEDRTRTDIQIDAIEHNLVPVGFLEPRSNDR